MVSGNGYRGINLDAAGPNQNLIEGNYVGINAAGTAAIGNGMPINGGGTGVSINGGSGNIVGGTDPGAANVLSGNIYGVGLGHSATNNLVEGNFIGTDPTGNFAIGNSGDGIISDSNANGNTITSNVISANHGPGILLNGISSDQILGNLIGTNFVGADLGNQGDGLTLNGGSGDTIGGTGTGVGNTIADNTGVGVVVTGNTSTGNSIRGNSIHDNGGLGIDLVDNGVTLNDSSGHVGPNNFQNFPVLTSALTTSNQTTITGTFSSGSINGTPLLPNATVFFDFYANPGY